jgi:hypothetical protein
MAASVPSASLDGTVAMTCSVAGLITSCMVAPGEGGRCW